MPPENQNPEWPEWAELWYERLRDRVGHAWGGNGELTLQQDIHCKEAVRKLLLKMQKVNAEVVQGPYMAGRPWWRITVMRDHPDPERGDRIRQRWFAYFDGHGWKQS